MGEPALSPDVGGSSQGLRGVVGTGRLASRGPSIVTRPSERALQGDIVLVVSIVAGPVGGHLDSDDCGPYGDREWVAREVEVAGPVVGPAVGTVTVRGTGDVGCVVPCSCRNDV